MKTYLELQMHASRYIITQESFYRKSFATNTAWHEVFTLSILLRWYIYRKIRIRLERQKPLASITNSGVGYNGDIV